MGDGETGRRGDGRESKPITFYLVPFTSYLLPTPQTIPSSDSRHRIDPVSAFAE
jgi:hypothetical protein